MPNYTATLHFTRSYTIDLEAEDIHHARRIAERYAELEDVDINDGESVYVGDVERVEEDV